MVTCGLAHIDTILTLLCLVVCSMPISITYILISIFPLFIFCFIVLISIMLSIVKLM